MFPITACVYPYSAFLSHFLLLPPPPHHAHFPPFSFLPVGNERWIFRVLQVTGVRLFVLMNEYGLVLALKLRQNRKNTLLMQKSDTFFWLAEKPRQKAAQQLSHRKIFFCHAVTGLSHMYRVAESYNGVTGLHHSVVFFTPHTHTHTHSHNHSHIQTSQCGSVTVCKTDSPPPLPSSFFQLYFPFRHPDCEL